MATDIPFWRRSTGAEQRIASLVRFLDSNSIEVRTFYLGQSGTDQFTAADQKKIKAQNLDVEQKSSDQPPQDLLNKIGWYTEATLNQISTWTGNNTNTESKPTDHQSLQLSDFRWPWAISAFAESVKNFQPNTVLVQYVKLAYLLEGLSSENRNSICCMLDTHDVLHLRNERFRENGHQHWIDIDRETESKAIQKFDIALAIQPEEAKVISQMAPNTKTIVCGHASFKETLRETTEENTVAQPEETKSNTHTLKVGYLGSLNASNKEAVSNLLTVLSELGSNEAIQIIIAGAICQCLDSESIPPNISDKVTLLGRVEDLNEFYDKVDLVVNPVTFGTGLKIKNTEALSFRKPLITTHHGAVGMEASNSNAIIVCQSTVEICQGLHRLAGDQDKLTRLKTAARRASESTTPEKVYAELLEALLKA